MEKIFDIAKDSEQKWGVIEQGIDGNFEEVETKITTKTEIEEDVKVDDYTMNDSHQFNVSSVSGAFVQSSSAGVHAIELHLTDEIYRIGYEARAWNGNYGYAFLNENDGLVFATKTTTGGYIEIDCKEYIKQGATKFRCSNNDGKAYISVKIYSVKEKDLAEIIKSIQKEDYFSGTKRFEFETIYEGKHNITEDGVNGYDREIRTGCGILRLAYNYTSVGNPSKLAIFFPGSSDFTSFNTQDFNDRMLPYIDFLCKSGYCVMSPYGWDNTITNGTFPCSYSLRNFARAYEYVKALYNIEQDGVYVWGRSLGGSNALAFAYNSGINVKALALHSPLMATMNYCNSNYSELLKKEVFGGDVNYEFSVSYYLQHYEDFASYESKLLGVVDKSRDDGVTSTIAYSLDASWGETHRVQRFPSKIWIPSDDVIGYDDCIYYWKSVVNAGGKCEFRRMPSNYTDQYVTTPIPHHCVDYAGPSADIITKLGYDCEKIATAYIEMVDFFDMN